MDEKPIVRIENWSVSYPKGSNPYYPPETISKGLCGKVYNHPHHSDGTYVRTTSIVGGSENKIETENTIYTLGEVDPEYVKWCEEQGVHIPTKKEPFKW